MMYPEEENIDDLFGDIDRFDRHDQSEEEDDDIDIGKAKSRKDSSDVEAQEDDESEAKKKKKTPKPKKVSANPQPKLDPDRLCGRRGILALHAAFKDIKLKGKGYEKDNLDLVMKKLDHWAHRLFPKLPFDDCIERVEKLGSKKPVQTYLKKIRMDLVDLDVTNEGGDIIEDNFVANNEPSEQQQAPVKDAFDDLLAHYSTRPAASSTTPNSSFSLTQQQQDRIAENKRRAEEKRKSRLNEIAHSETSDMNKTVGEAAPSVNNEELMDIDSMLDDIPQD